MKTMKWMIPVALLAVLLSSCDKKGFPIKGKGDNVTETRALSSFSQVDLSIDAEVTFIQDSIYSVEVSAQSNVLAVLTTKVEDGELEIDFKRNVWKHKTIRIIVHSPTLTDVDISGSGSVTVQNALTTPSLDLEISGSGMMTLPTLTATSLSADISGSGNLNILGGTVQTQHCEISGSGNINHAGLVSATTSATISGSGSITVYVTQTLNASISGSGDVRYYGNPAINTTISGSGSLIHL